MLHHQDKHEEAEEIHQHLLELCQKVQDSEQPDVAVCTVLSYPSVGLG